MIDTNDVRAQVPYPVSWESKAILALCDEIDRLNGEQQTPQGKTVDVRVAVAVDKDGHWCANGWKDATSEEARDTASEMVDEGESIFWLTATLPVPADVEVVARVERE